MTDFDDDLINGAFGGFAAAAAPSVRSAGADAVRSTVTHRRKVRAGALGLLAAILVAAPVAAYATITGESNGPPVTPADSAGPSPTRDVTPSVTPSATTAGAPAGPDGRISIAQLNAGKVTLPAWGPRGTPSVGQVCATGRVQLVKEDSRDFTVFVRKVVHTNLDADSSLETAALVYCVTGEVNTGQVVVFDRDATGKIVTLGQVLKSTDTMNGIWDITVGPQGELNVDVSNIVACCATPKATVVHQIRTFAWTGTRIAQTGGPTYFLKDDKAVDLGATFKESTWGPTVQVSGPDGVKRPYRTLTVVLRVTNHSSSRSGQWVVTAIDATAGSGVDVPHPALDGNEAVDVTVTMLIASGTASNDGIEVRVEELGSTETVADPVITNNWPLVKFPA